MWLMATILDRTGLELGMFPGRANHVKDPRIQGLSGYRILMSDSPKCCHSPESLPGVSCWRAFFPHVVIQDPATIHLITPEHPLGPQWLLCLSSK